MQNHADSVFLNGGGVILVGWPGSNYAGVFAALTSVDAYQDYCRRYAIERPRTVSAFFTSIDDYIKKQHPDKAFIVLTPRQHDDLAEEILETEQLLESVSKLSAYHTSRVVVLLTSAQFCAQVSLGNISADEFHDRFVKCALPVRHIFVSATQESIWNLLAGHCYDQDNRAFARAFPSVEVQRDPGVLHHYNMTIQTSMTALNSYGAAQADAAALRARLLQVLFGFHHYDRNLGLDQQLMSCAMQAPLGYGLHRKSSLPIEQEQVDRILDVDALWSWICSGEFAASRQELRQSVTKACTQRFDAIVPTLPQWVQQFLQRYRKVGHYQDRTVDIATVLDSLGIPGRYCTAALAYLEGLGVFNFTVGKRSTSLNPLWSRALNILPHGGVKRSKE
ncbi:MAG: hypothetical protein WC505_07720 [Patescibacteria group bacterium]